MEMLHETGLAIILALQKNLPAILIRPLQGASFLGEELFYMLIIPILFWFVRPELAIRLLWILLLSALWNDAGKWMLHAPRPFWLSDAIRPMAHESSFGPPSGHAQNAMALWLYAAYYLRKDLPAFLYAAIFIILSISFSRMALGVHFLHCILSGWTSGIIVLLFAIFLLPHLEKFVLRRNTKERVTLALSAVALLLLGNLAIYALNVAHQPAPEFIDRARQSGILLDPLSLKSSFNNTGALLGAMLGLLLLQKAGGFEPEGNLKSILLRALIGFAGIAIFKEGLSAIFPGDDSELALLLRFLRYGLILLWAVWLAPLTFIKLKLTRKQYI